MNNRKKLLLALAAIFLVWWWFSLPSVLFNDPLSTVIEDQEGHLLGAHIASDGQWRFPQSDSLPEKFILSVITFEDKRFNTHIGVDIRSLARAFWQNIKTGRVVSGASTISMQTIRMSRDNPPRTVWQKVIEILLAVRLELRYSKNDILNLWAGHAPFGGNVVGLETASWRYYGKSPHLLSWAEAATLAILPNSPALIHPGRNRTDLKDKRDRLLKKLYTFGHLSKEDYQLSLLETLPGKPLPLPRLAPHLLDRIVQEKGEGRWVVTIDKTIQENVIELGRFHQKKLSGNGIHNLAILVVDTHSGEVMAYMGNPPNIAKNHSPEVDLIRAARSPGSLLKPLLYSLALEQGSLLPNQLLVDVPCFFNGFKPENFHENYSGAVPAQRCLSQSLNIPFVFMLQKYGVPGFHKALQDWQFSFVNQPPEHYGLSLILGGCEVSLWQAVGWYSSLGRMVGNHYNYQAQYNWDDWRLPHYLSDKKPKEAIQLHDDPFLVGAGAGWHTLEALQQLKRPNSEGSWKKFQSSRKIAWKTGTSFGFRDAWAVGVTPDYTIGIWVGNADGEGRPGLVGVQAAAPLLFDVLRILPQRQTAWFEQAYDDSKQLDICIQSGFIASVNCPKESRWVPANGAHAGVCPYHKVIHLNDKGNLRVNRSCAGNSGINTQTWFSLPPLQAHYYQAQHPEYKKMPAWAPACKTFYGGEQMMQWIYPRHSGKIQLARDWEGGLNEAVFSITHQNPEKKVFWHLDQHFLGSTQRQHRMKIIAGVGRHHIVVEDEDGLRLEKWFELVE